MVLSMDIDILIYSQMSYSPFPGLLPQSPLQVVSTSSRLVCVTDMSLELEASGVD